MSDEADKQDVDPNKPGVIKRHAKKITWSSIATVFVGGLSTGAVDMYAKWRELKLESAANSEELRPAILEIQGQIPKIVVKFTEEIRDLKDEVKEMKGRVRKAEDRALVYETIARAKNPRQYRASDRTEAAKPEAKTEKSPVVKLMEKAQEAQQQQQQMQEYLPKEKVHKDMRGAKEALKDRLDL